MATPPLVSIIMPAYNAAHFIGEAIRSVQAQTLTDWELIIVDDGSTDHTAEIVRGFEDPRIRYMERSHCGYPSVIRNHGLEQARGLFLAFLDADDLFLPHKLCDQAAFLQQRPEVGLVAGGYHCVDAEGKILATVTPWTTFPNLDLETWITACPVWILQILVRREQVEQIGGFDPDILHGEDYDLLLRLALAGCRMAWYEKVVCCYRLHEENRSLAIERRVKCQRQVLCKFFARSDLPPEIRAQQDKALKEADRIAALWTYAAGDAERGAAYLASFLADRKWTPAMAQTVATTLAIQIATPMLRRDPLALVDLIWAHLPPEAEPLKPLHRFARASAARHLFFEAWQRGDRPAMRRMFWQVLRNEPRLLDRGMLSLLARSHIPILERG